MKPFALPLVALALLPLAPLSLSAGPVLLGNRITIPDLNATSGWYGSQEDNETESNPNTVVGQQWDLENVYLNGSLLSLVGGYDFKNGATIDGRNYRSGDLFVDVTGNAAFGPAAAGSGATSYGTPQPILTTNLLGYDFAVQLNFAAMTYNVYALTQGTSVVSRVTEVATSNPWRYVSGGTPVNGYQNVAFQYFGPLSAAGAGDTSLLGYGGNGNHFVLQIDTSFLPAASTATFHYTMECGNDNLMGRAVTGSVPDAATSSLLMLAGAVLAFGGLRRRFA